MAGQCTACGSPLEEGARFCRVCGTGVPGVSGETVAPSPPPGAAASPSGPDPGSPAGSAGSPPGGPYPAGGAYPPGGGGQVPPPPGAPPGPAPAYPATWSGPPPPGPAYAPAGGEYGPRPIDHILAHGYKIDVGRALTDGWRLFTLDPVGYILFALVSGFLGLLLSITVIGLIALPALFAGFWVVPLMMLKGRRTSFGDFFKGFSFFGSLLVLGIVEAVLISLGLIFFIIPGLYLWIAWTWALALILDRGMGFWEALSISMKVVNKNFWETLLLVFVAAIIMSAGGLVIFGSLVTVPLGYCMLAVGYRDVFGLDPRR
jgi:hypothetical protein